MSEFVDLTLLLEPGMISYPSPAHPRFESAVIGRIPIEGRATRRLTLGSHTGTHVDAPLHFLPDGEGIDALPVTLLAGDAWLIDLAPATPGTVFSPDDILPKLPGHPVERLLLRTDWSDRFWNTSQFYNDWPVLDRAVTEALIGRGVRLLGIDFPSPDPAYSGADPDLDCPNHKRFFAAGTILVEYLTGLGHLSPGPVFLAALPLKLAGFDGAPARVIAKCASDL
jgi:kynurenine formamidase